MQVEMRIRGVAERVAVGAFPEHRVRVDRAETVVSGPADDEADALALIERARSIGLTVVGWRLVELGAGEQ